MNQTEKGPAKPPTILGILVAVLGFFLVGGGIWLMSKGASPYFLAIGVGLAISGVLLAKGMKTGLFVYAITLGIILVWSFIETQGDTQALLPRVAIPIMIAIYLAQSKVRATLK